MEKLEAKKEGAAVSDNTVEELMDKLARLEITDEQYARNYAVLVSLKPSVARIVPAPQYRQLLTRMSTPAPGLSDRATNPQTPNSGDNASRMASCFYCGKPTCRVATCPDLGKDMLAGRVRHEAGFVVYKDGSRLKRGPNGLKDDVMARITSETTQGQIETSKPAQPNDPYGMYVIQVEEWPGESAEAGTYTLSIEEEEQVEYLEQERDMVEALAHSMIAMGMDEETALDIAINATLDRANRSQSKATREAATPYNRENRPSRDQRRVQLQAPHDLQPVLAGEPSKKPAPSANQNPAIAPRPARTTPFPMASTRAPLPSQKGKEKEVPEIQMDMGSDKPATKRSIPQFRYSSDIEERGDSTAIMAKLLGMSVPSTITVGEMLSVSSALRKQFAELCKTKRLPTDINRQPTDVKANVIAAPMVLREPSFILPLPKIKIKVNDVVETALYDTGSQVNLFTEAFANYVGLPVNNSHTISMSGVNGREDRSLGVCEYVDLDFGPVTTRGHYHVFRVAPFVAILGQPFIRDHVLGTTDDGETYRIMLRDFHDPNKRVSIALRSSQKPTPLNVKVSTNSLQVKEVGVFTNLLSRDVWSTLAGDRIEEIEMDQDEDGSAASGFVRQLNRYRA
jgi:hypothetical protein